MFVDYSYIYHPGKRLSDYGMEQQACIVADYFYLKNYGYVEFAKLRPRLPGGYFGMIDNTTILKIREILDGSGIIL
ncbi:hypothetical protein CDR68_24675 [Salmonella enterica]|nr:hypothetical protein [Salmonella enterica]